MHICFQISVIILYFFNQCSIFNLEITYYTKKSKKNHFEKLLISNYLKKVSIDFSKMLQRHSKMERQFKAYFLYPYFPFYKQFNIKSINEIDVKKKDKLKIDYFSFIR